MLPFYIVRYVNGDTIHDVCHCGQCRFHVYLGTKVSASEETVHQAHFRFNIKILLPLLLTTLHFIGMILFTICLVNNTHSKTELITLLYLQQAFQIMGVRVRLYCVRERV